MLAAALPSNLPASAPAPVPPPTKAVSRDVASAGSTASITAAATVVHRGTDAGGLELARRMAKDPALRRTLQALQSGKGKAGTPAASIVVGGSVADIPAVALAAYQRGAYFASSTNPGCNIPWTLVAGIGRVESDHGQNGGSRPGTGGEVRPTILGPVLDGSGGNAAIADTDGGRLDGDTRWDRAVGPMQFIPSTWAADGRDGNGDRIRDPENMFDAALAAADYLCASGGDLRTPAAAERAVLSYNHSLDYVLVVLGYTRRLRRTEPLLGRSRHRPLPGQSVEGAQEAGEEGGQEGGQEAAQTSGTQAGTAPVGETHGEADSPAFTQADEPSDQ